jgi:CheY-like chemotaxis protein
MNRPTNLIIIDDDEFFHFIAKKQFKAFDLAPERIYSYHNGKEALDAINETLKTSMSAIILLDLNMPVLNGWEFLEEVQTRLPDFSKTMTVFICSSSIDREDIDKAKRHPLVSDYLVKPLNREKVEFLVAQYLN